MKYLITGGAGFLGTNLSVEVLNRKSDLVVFDDLSRTGSSQNLEWLKRGTDRPFRFHKGDIRRSAEVDELLRTEKPDVIFHLAGQVAMTTSITDPRKDFEINALGSLNLLEAARKYAPEATIIYSSTNKVYGDLKGHEFDEERLRYHSRIHPRGFDESLTLEFCSPYGCSKGAADQYMLDYARVFSMNTVVFRHSSIFGGRQFSTSDQGWVGWFVLQAVQESIGRGEEFTISGNGKQVRDVLFSSDLVACYFSAEERIKAIRGEAFNIGGGIENSLSLLELFEILERKLNVKLRFRKLPERQSDQKIFVADITKATKALGWIPKVRKDEGIEKMIEWVKANVRS